MRRRRRPRVSSDPVVAVGWIFADLLLGLVVVLLASQVIMPKKPVADTPKPSPSVKTLATMEKKPDSVVLSVNAGGLLSNNKGAVKQLRRSIRDKTADLRKQKREAAMVLIWGWAPNTGVGTSIASKVESNLEVGTGKLFAKSRKRPLWQNGPEGRVELEIYLYEQERAK